VEIPSLPPMWTVAVDRLPLERTYPPPVAPLGRGEL
jgi:hypothetical protein